LFNSTIAGIDTADALLLVGSNPRHESPVLNARIRQRWLTGRFPIGVVGPSAELTYAAEFLGDAPDLLSRLAGGTHAFAKSLSAASRPMLIVGQGALMRPDGAAILATTWKLAEACGALKPDWHGFNVLHTAAARAGALDLGFVPGATGKPLAAMLGGGVDLLWLLGADEIDTSAIGQDTFVIYQGHHGDRGAARADVILPGAAYTEKDGTYVNTEGRVQHGFRALYPPGEAREDWKILRAMSEFIGRTLPYDNLAEIRARLVQLNPVFARTGAPRFGATNLAGPSAGSIEIGDAPLLPAIGDYFQTNVISRASRTMAECSRIYTPAPALAAE
jgi:NADH-quinone oxidoreductase subunit G